VQLLTRRRAAAEAQRRVPESLENGPGTDGEVSYVGVATDPRTDAAASQLMEEHCEQIVGARSF